MSHIIFSKIRRLVLFSTINVTTYCDASENNQPINKQISYDINEITKNNGQYNRPLWITHENKVYDLTNFKHPGGKFILQAGGSSVESFWDYWRIHYDNKTVQEVLRDHCIGSLKTKDLDNVPVIISDNNYHDEPNRPNHHKPYSKQPFDSQLDTNILIQNQITPIRDLYIRNHAPVPILDHDHNIFLSNIKDDSVKLDLNRYDFIKQISTLQCAGNRAGDDFKATGPNNFTNKIDNKLGNGQVGNIEWGGYSIEQIIIDHYPDQVKEELESSLDIWHIIFKGADQYVSSTNLKTILKTRGMIATHANGLPLTADHGYPVRVVLPGIVGARNVKWLEEIELSKEPADYPWNQNYYNDSDGKSIQNFPIQSIIMSHQIKDNKITIRGVTYTDGIEIDNVQVSDGKIWHECQMEKSLGPYSWRRWNITLDHNSNIYYSKATDQNGTVQPKVSEKQNGYIYNGYSSISV